MLTSLLINNIVLIERLHLAFQDGLCTLTGETGAGKSILLDSLGLALGARAEARLVRKGAEQAAVTANFDLAKDHAAFAVLADQGILIDDDQLILRRTLAADGRSKAFINDQPVSVALLAQIGALLVEIHGQFETQGLLDPGTHRGLLDDYAGLTPDLKKLGAAYHAWKDAEAALIKAETDAETARAEEDYLRASLEDLDALNPQPGEEKELVSLRDRLMGREQILEGLNTAYYALNGDHDPVNAATSALSRIAGKFDDEGLNTILDTLDRANAELREAVSLIQSLSADLSESDYNLQEIDDRLHALKAQARKHGCAIDDLSVKRDELAGKLSLIERTDDVLSGLMKAATAAKKSYLSLADDLSAKRRKAAGKLDTEVAAELPPLKMDRAAFVTDVTSLNESEWNETGKDRVRFLVATNPGAEPGPLHKIASGGEMSRFMLALKVIMAELGSAETLIFDEVDSGIGGATADAVGERLARLGETKQVLVVTHSPQVAARGAHHWIVKKDGTAAGVTTNVIPLDQRPARREEIARMLSGADITDEARKAADKLLEGKVA